MQLGWDHGGKDGGQIFLFGAVFDHIQGQVMIFEIQVGRGFIQHYTHMAGGGIIGGTPGVHVIKRLRVLGNAELFFLYSVHSSVKGVPCPADSL